MICKTCGADVPLRKPNQTGRQAEFCSDPCRSSFHYAPKVNKSCERCGTGFTVYAVNKLKRFCSKDCYNAGRIIRNEAMHKSCELCGNAFVTQIKRQRYCSNSCRYEANAMAQASKWREQNPKPQMYVYDCDWCGLKIESNTHIGGTKRYHPNDCRKQAQDARYRAKTVKRQQAGIRPSRIVVEQLVAVYGAVCYLCSEPIDLTVPRTSAMGATVDHIMPLSKGGTDDFENLQLAHWVCNNRKSDKLIEGINA